MKTLFKVIDGLFIFFAANYFWLIEKTGLWLLVFPTVILFLIVNVFPSPANISIKGMRLRICADGSDLLFSFLMSATMSGIFYIITGFYFIPSTWWVWAINAVITIFVLSVVFWNGIIRVYCTSVQLGIKYKASVEFHTVI